MATESLHHFLFASFSTPFFLSCYGATTLYPSNEPLSSGFLRNFLFLFNIIGFPLYYRCLPKAYIPL
jgi:hypothetical protein